MGKQTSANMRPCKCSSAERHNRREIELGYVRKDLTPLNCYKEWVPISKQREKIQSEYRKVTGQKMQPTAQPIQEIVLIINKDTTPEQVEKFCDLIRQLGMTPLSYAMHKDEGHTDTETGEWVPNYHAHIVADTTCWEHKYIERTKKKNGKNVIDPKTHKPEKVMVDAYAKTIKFTREDMSRLQDFASEATGLARGVSSARTHEEARQFKAREQAREIARQKEVINHQEAIIAEQEKGMREQYQSMQFKAMEVVYYFDLQRKVLEQYGLSIDDVVIKQRDFLKQESLAVCQVKTISDIMDNNFSISDYIVDVAMATAEMARRTEDLVERERREKERQLTSIRQKIKERSILKTAKEAMLVTLDLPANKQAKTLQSEVAALRTMLDEKVQDENNLKDIISSLQNKLSAQTDTIGKYRTSINEIKEKISQYQKRVDMLTGHIENDRMIIASLREHIRGIAQMLIDNANPKLLHYYEQIGIHRYIGEDIWQEEKESREYGGIAMKHSL